MSGTLRQPAQMPWNPWLLTGTYSEAAAPAPPVGAPAPAPVAPANPAAPLGALPSPPMVAPIFAGAAPEGGGQDAQTSRYDPIPSPHQTWGGLLDAIANAATFAANPIGGALGFMANAIANPQGRSIGMMGLLGGRSAGELLDSWLGPEAAALPGSWTTKDGRPGEGAMFGTPPGSGATIGTPEAIPDGLIGDMGGAVGGGYMDPTFGFLPDIAMNGIPNPAPPTPSWDGDGAGTPSGDVHGGPSSTDNSSFRAGGLVPGEGPVPATVHGGEFVLRPEAVDRYGVALLRALNDLRVPPSRLAMIARMSGEMPLPVVPRGRNTY